MCSDDVNGIIASYLQFNEIESFVEKMGIKGKFAYNMVPIVNYKCKGSGVPFELAKRVFLIVMVCKVRIFFGDDINNLMRELGDCGKYIHTFALHCCSSMYIRWIPPFVTLRRLEIVSRGSIRVLLDKNMKSLYLDGCGNVNNHDVVVKRVRHLKMMDWSGFVCVMKPQSVIKLEIVKSPEMMGFWECCANLRCLVIKFGHGKNIDLSRLSVERLELYNCDVIGWDKLRGVKHLSVSGCRGLYLGCLSQCIELEYLNMDMCDEKDVGVAALPNLRRLKMRGTKRGQINFDVIGRCRGLEHFDGEMGYFNCGNIGINLRTIRLSKVRARKTGKIYDDYDFLAKCKGLEEIMLNKSSVRSVKFANNLKRVELVDCDKLVVGKLEGCDEIVLKRCSYKEIIVENCKSLVVKECGNVNIIDVRIRESASLVVCGRVIIDGCESVTDVRVKGGYYMVNVHYCPMLEYVDLIGDGKMDVVGCPNLINTEGAYGIIMRELRCIAACSSNEFENIGFKMLSLCWWLKNWRFCRAHLMKNEYRLCLVINLITYAPFIFDDYLMIGRMRRVRRVSRLLSLLASIVLGGYVGLILSLIGTWLF